MPEAQLAAYARSGMGSVVTADPVALRLMARHADLRRALREAEVKAAARAASRIRLVDLELAPRERRAARSARALLGRALREARLRAKDQQMQVVIARPATARRVSQPVSTLLQSVAAVLFLFLLWGLFPRLQVSRTLAVDPGGAPAGGVVADARSQLLTSESSRGRTSDTFALTAEPAAPSLPSPSEAPAATPNAAAPSPHGAGSGSGGAGGAGGGTGTGIGSGSGSGVTPPAPTQTPIPPVAAGYTRIRGRVIDSLSGIGVAGVCLVPGSLDCDLTKPHSDANGYWVIDVTDGTYWDVRFQMVGYRIARIRVYAGGRDTNVGNIRIVRTVSATP